MSDLFKHTLPVLTIMTAKTAIVRGKAGYFKAAYSYPYFFITAHHLVERARWLKHVLFFIGVRPDPSWFAETTRSVISDFNHHGFSFCLRQANTLHQFEHSPSLQPSKSLKHYHPLLVKGK